jgi:putative Ca2+/H+ antiporter (TMEM165/GDT1 family)
MIWILLFLRIDAAVAAAECAADSADQACQQCEARRRSPPNLDSGVDSWYDEVKLTGFSSGTGHYTQVTYMAQLYQLIVESGAVRAFPLIFVSEIGDKTFFITALLASKASKWAAFAGCMLAVTVMSGFAVAIGQWAHSLDALSGFAWDTYLAVGAFLFFGVGTLKEAYDTPAGQKTAEEKQAAQEDVDRATATSKVRQFVLTRLGLSSADAARNVGAFLTAFGLVLAAEFGDRSFFSTMALTASATNWGIFAGSLLAHGATTLLAVTGGAWIAQQVSDKTCSSVAGILFLIFAGTTALGGF